MVTETTYIQTLTAVGPWTQTWQQPGPKNIWSHVAGQVIQISMALLVAWRMENLMVTVCCLDTGLFSYLLWQHGPLNSIKSPTVVGSLNQHGSRQQYRPLRLAWPHGRLVLGLQWTQTRSLAASQARMLSLSQVAAQVTKTGMVSAVAWPVDTHKGPGVGQNSRLLHSSQW